MTVKSVKIGADPDVLKVGLSDGSFLLFRVSYLSEGAAYPAVASELSAETLESYRRAEQTYKVETSALRLVSLREHSRFLLRQKLIQREFPESAVKTVIDRLVSSGLLDDERYASLWVESRLASKHESRTKLMGGLLARGLSREIAERVTGRLVDEEQELQAAQRFRDKLLRSSPCGNEMLSKKLRAAGFSSKIIRALFNRDDS